LLETLQKLLPWLSELPIAGKVPLTVVVVAVAGFVIGVMWSPPIQSLSADRVRDLLFELSDIQSNKARWEEIEPLAERAKAILSPKFPEQAAEIDRAQHTYASVDPVGRVLRTQLQIVYDKLKK
jgi:hypothetical protein